MPESIDRIFAHTLASLAVRSDYHAHRDIARAIRDALERGGYVIVEADRALLAKGRESGVNAA